MEVEEGSSRASSSFAPAPPPSSSKLTATPSKRQRFSVELRPGETTIVSWKRLVKDSNRATQPPSAPDPSCDARPALECRIAPAACPRAPLDGEQKDALPPPNRFSAVIEKIERLYMGKQSSDEEELDDVPDEDEYDTQDSFIDDAELDEYFQVDKLTTKHDGFFVNRGMLERLNELVSSPNHAPKKRRRKDSTKDRNQVDGGDMPSNHVKIGDVRKKAAGSNEPFMGSYMSSLSQGPLPSKENCQGVKSTSNQLNVPLRSSKKKSADTTSNSEYPSVEAQNKDPSEFPMETKHIEKQKTDVIQSRHLGDKLKVTNGTNRGVSVLDEHHPREALNGSNERELSTKIWHREKNGGGVLPDMKSSGSKYPGQTAKSQSILSKEGSGVGPTSIMLEQAIQELEKIVAESRPPTIEVQEADGSSQGVKRRLPREVKQHLAKVARLAQSNQGRISEELIIRLMSIVGHIMQLKTLKRNLKKMVELGLSAKKEKEERFQQLKNEVNEMIRMRASIPKSTEAKQQDGSSDDFQDEHHGSDRKRKYSMDDAMEDKICDLYDLYVEGMDEDKGSDIRKLYMELAELWPSATMNKHGIKKAINRSKERRTPISIRLKEKEEIRRKKISAADKMDETIQGEASVNAQPQTAQDRAAADSSRSLMMTDKPISSSTERNVPFPTFSEMSNRSLEAPSLDRPRNEKVRVSINMVDEAGSGKATKVAVMKKKVKRKAESYLGEVHACPVKRPSPSEPDSEKRHKHALHRHHKSSPQPAIFQGCEQPS